MLVGKFSSNIKSTGAQSAVQYRICPAITRNIWLADNLVEVFNEHLSLLVGHYVPTKVIRSRNKDKPWFDDQCRNAFSLKGYFIFIIFEKVGSGRLRESGIHSISLKTLAPQYQPIDRKKRKGIKVEDYSRDRAV